MKSKDGTFVLAIIAFLCPTLIAVMIGDAMGFEVWQSLLFGMGVGQAASHGISGPIVARHLRLEARDKR